MYYRSARREDMQYNTRAFLAMIASAINPGIPEVQNHDDLAELEATPDRNALVVYMADGRQFRITVE